MFDDLMFALAKVTGAAKVVSLHHDDCCYADAYDPDCLLALDRLADAVDSIEQLLPGCTTREADLVRRQMHTAADQPLDGLLLPLDPNHDH